MKARRYALDPTFGMLIACPNGCDDKGRMEIMESQDRKGPYEDVEMRCTHCEEVSSFHPKPPFLSLEFKIDSSA